MPPAEANNPPFVLIRRYLFLSDAVLGKTVLDSAGVESLLSDANTIRVDWFWSNLLGGVKLWTRENEADDGLALLDQEIPEKFEVEGQDEYAQPRCPKCRSYDVSSRELVKLPTYLGTFILNIPIQITRRDLKCNNCGNIWK